MKVTSGKLPGKVRIIGGRWRGRKLPVADVAGLRPTPDRLRETLFNWLAPYLPGAQCLDLFAGSGALGLEALSRGAARAVLVEHDPVALGMLRQVIAALDTDAAELVAADALVYLKRIETPFDIAFLDPPYRSDLLAPCADLLARHGLVRPGGFVYLEFARGGRPALPEPGFDLHRDGRAGDVECLLLRRVDG